ncbi:unnamed protein product [Anisakis simplex]|uniref:NTF2 domain-containing protein n=1 Tax=Anisakis simplex TaxID=6269 RepID=A0A158PPS1_ANISI|nr:unnamed protein product [Anisakis simplex]
MERVPSGNGQFRSTKNSTSEASSGQNENLYTTVDSNALHHAVQKAVSNYYSACVTRPARMTICIDYTQGAPASTSLSPFLNYRNPSVVLRMSAGVDATRVNKQCKVSEHFYSLPSVLSLPPV